MSVLAEVEEEQPTNTSSLEQGREWTCFGRRDARDQATQSVTVTAKRPLSTPPAAPLCARHDRAGICKYDGAVLGGGPRQGVCIHTGVTPRIHLCD